MVLSLTLPGGPCFFLGPRVICWFRLFFVRLDYPAIRARTVGVGGASALFPRPVLLTVGPLEEGVHWSVAPLVFFCLLSPLTPHCGRREALPTTDVRAPRGGALRARPVLAVARPARLHVHAGGVGSAFTPLPDGGLWTQLKHVSTFVTRVPMLPCPCSMCRRGGESLVSLRCFPFLLFSHNSTHAPFVGSLSSSSPPCCTLSSSARLASFDCPLRRSVAMASFALWAPLVELGSTCRCRLRRAGSFCPSR